VDATERSRPRRVTQAVFRAIQEVNKQLPKEQQLPQSIDAVLFEGVGGRAGGLDSLGLLNLIVTLEQEIEAEFGIGLTLTREDIINEQERPFETAGALVNYVCSLLEEKACE
jgi:acyl carrier protein